MEGASISGADRLRCPVCEQGLLEDFRSVKQQQYLRCPACQATVMAPDCWLSRDQEKAIYDQHQNDPDDSGYRGFLNRLAEPLLERIPAGARGLDFGCGPGPALALMLREGGLSVSLYDPFYHPDTGALARQYDFVTCTEVVEHLHQPARVFRQLYRLLRPGGWLGIMTCFQTDDARFDNWHYRRDPTHVVFYRAHTLQVIADQLGLELVIPAKDVALFRRP